MVKCGSSLMLALLLGSPAFAREPKPAPADKVLFDFEDVAEVKAWSNLELPGAGDKEPAAKIERSTDTPTSGKHSLKITFVGGRWPTLTTTRLPGDWTAWATFKADVTVNRRCVVGFTVLQEKSKRGGGWEAGVSRWTKTAFLEPGKNRIAAPLRASYGSTIRPEQGKVVRLELFMYNPHEGESIYVDNIRLLAAKEPVVPPARTRFKVLGTDLVVASVQELGKKLAGRWARPAAQTVEQIEASFRDRFAELTKQHPKAVLALFRDGDKGFDPAHPDKVYSGWKDAYWSSHGPDGLTVERGTNYGKQATQEVFMRHRSPLFRVDLSSIPRGSKILAATLLIVRAGEPGGKDHGTDRATMWVAEPCNRPWQEYEVNAYQFAKDRFWKAVGGMHWGNDPDFLPVYVAHGPSQPGVSTWDFTHAVRFWTGGKHPNHGFMLHGDSKDWFRAWFREAKKIKDRPAVLVIYEPR